MAAGRISIHYDHYTPVFPKLYFAKSGEAAVMSELLLRGLNVASPAVDIGDDIYVVSDENAILKRVQVKSSNCKKTSYGFVGSVRLEMAQLLTPKETKLIYIFALRSEERWRFIVISREDLEREAQINKIGNQNKSKRDLWLRFRYYEDEGKLTCSGEDFTKYLNWETEFSTGL